jgi:hypothetical protein
MDLKEYSCESQYHHLLHCTSERTDVLTKEGLVPRCLAGSKVAARLSAAEEADKEGLINYKNNKSSYCKSVGLFRKNTRHIDR